MGSNKAALVLIFAVAAVVLLLVMMFFGGVDWSFPPIAVVLALVVRRIISRTTMPEVIMEKINRNEEYDTKR